MTPPRRGRLAFLAAALLCLPPAVGALAAAKPHAHCAPVRAAGGEWRSYGHDYRNTRSQPAEHRLGVMRVPLLQKAFAFSAHDAGGDGDFTGTPVIADGCLFLGSNTGWVFAANADTGAPVWSTHLDPNAEIPSTVYVTAGRVYVAVSRIGSPYVAALDERTGRVLWRTTIDHQSGSDAYASPIVYDGVLFEGVSAGSAELGDSADRDAFEGAFALIETRGRHAGRILRKTWTVHPPGRHDELGGASVWSTPAVDTARGIAYVGAGNPFHPEKEPAHADSILKIDLNRESPTFGAVIGHYKGQIEEYEPALQHSPCFDTPGNPPPYYPQGAGGCGDLDLDFGAAPNLFHDGGRLLVGEGQKSGVYHVVDATTMRGVRQTIVGPPSDFGGVVGSTATDGHAVFGPLTLGGYVWSLDAGTGTQRWVSPIADGLHWGNPVSLADGVVYTMGLTGFLDAYDAATGAVLLHHPVAADVPPGNPVASWGGVSIARHTVYASVGITGLPNGYVVGYRSAGLGPTSLPVTNAGQSAGRGAAATVLSGPQAQAYGYLTPVVVTRQGGPVSYTNIDLVRHNVVQDVRADHLHGPATASWCRQFRKGQCPLFWTPLIGLTETTSLRGLARVKPGTYSFYCTIHPGMKGKLVVLP